MKISFNKEDFEKLQKVDEINGKYFDSTKGYSIEEKRNEAINLQNPARNKMKILKNALLNEAYFHNRFDIKISMPNKQTNQFLFGQIRRLVWLSLVPWAELLKIKGKSYGHQRLPQIQVSLHHDKFIIASIWLEGNGCEQKYRDIFFDFIETNEISSRYTIKIHKKDAPKAAFENTYEKLIPKDFFTYRQDKSYSLGIEKILTIQETAELSEEIYSYINNELQAIIENVFIPCFNYRVGKKIKLSLNIDRIKRKARKKFEIINAVRKGSEPTIVTKKHQEIQNALLDSFTTKYENSGYVTKLEEDFVDLKIEDSANKSLTLYEIKTNDKAINCIKSGLGQLLFYNLMNRKNDWKEIKLVIVGLHKMSVEAKEFVQSIKEYLGEDVFSYQRFDEDKKVLLDEKKS